MKQRQTYPNQPFPQAFRGQPWPLEPQGPRLDLNSGCGLRWLPSFFFQAPNGPKTPEKAMKYVGRENFSDVMKLWVVFFGRQGWAFHSENMRRLSSTSNLGEDSFPKGLQGSAGLQLQEDLKLPTWKLHARRCPVSLVAMAPQEIETIAENENGSAFEVGTPRWCWGRDKNGKRRRWK